jgi:hypothetical protein
MSNKRKNNKMKPFHIAHKFKQYELKDGTKFWAKHGDKAELYRMKAEGS